MVESLRRYQSVTYALQAMRTLQLAYTVAQHYGNSNSPVEESPNPALNNYPVVVYDPRFYSRASPGKNREQAASEAECNSTQTRASL